MPIILYATLPLSCSTLCCKEKSHRPASPYSPDIAPSDFFLFGDLKRELRGARFRISEEVLIEMQKLVGEISPETLLNTFRDWIS
jgi:hypothetical protein